MCLSLSLSCRGKKTSFDAEMQNVQVDQHKMLKCSFSHSRAIKDVCWNHPTLNQNAALNFIGFQHFTRLSPQKEREREEKTETKPKKHSENIYFRLNCSNWLWLLTGISSWINCGFYMDHYASRGCSLLMFWIRNCIYTQLSAWFAVSCSVNWFSISIGSRQWFIFHRLCVCVGDFCLQCLTAPRLNALIILCFNITWRDDEKRN